MKTISKTRKFYSTPDPLNFRPSPEFHANKTRFLHSPEPNIQNKNAENDLRQNVKQIFGLQFHKPHCGAHSFAIDRIDREQINNIQFPNARLEIIYPKIHFEFRALPRPIIIILLFVYTIWICFLISRILPTPIERTKKKKNHSVNKSIHFNFNCVYKNDAIFSACHNRMASGGQQNEWHHTGAVGALEYCAIRNTILQIDFH